MLSSRTVRCFNFNGVPSIFQFQSPVTKVHGRKTIVRELSVWSRTSSLRNGFLQTSRHHQCSMCKVVDSFKQTQLINLVGRSMSTKKGREKSTSDSADSLPAFVDPDVGDIIDDDENPLNKPKKRGRSGERVKVKFNWKNALVTTDSLTLLENLYQTHPQLVEFDENDLVDYLQRMSVHALHVEQAAKMVIMNPRLLSLKDDTIGNCISALRSMGLSESQRGHILRTVPEIFNFPTKRILEQFTFLKTYFSTEETVLVIAKSVEVFLESEATLRKKLEYLIKEMSHETKSIVTCKAISYPLRHMKTRHEFLIRAGLFKPIPYRKLIKVLDKEYRDRNKPRNKYFKPIEIVCYTDQDFLKACTKNLITLNELVAFEELYAAELDVAEDDDVDEEEDEANDNEDDDLNSDAVSLVKAPNSIGFFSDVEAKSCYF